MLVLFCSVCSVHARCANLHVRLGWLLVLLYPNARGPSLHDRLARLLVFLLRCLQLIHTAQGCTIAGLAAVLVRSLRLARACRLAWLLVLSHPLCLAHARRLRLPARVAWLLVLFVLAVLSPCTPSKATCCLGLAACTVYSLCLASCTLPEAAGSLGLPAGTFTFRRFQLMYAAIGCMFAWLRCLFF